MDLGPDDQIRSACPSRIRRFRYRDAGRDIVNLSVRRLITGGKSLRDPSSSHSELLALCAKCGGEKRIEEVAHPKALWVCDYDDAAHLIEPGDFECWRVSDLHVAPTGAFRRECLEVLDTTAVEHDTRVEHRSKADAFPNARL